MSTENAVMSYREMTFEEEAKIYEDEAMRLFEKETEGSETPFANCVVRRGRRIIVKARREIEEEKAYAEKHITFLTAENKKLKKQLEKYETIKSVADELVMYEKIGVIINRMADESLKDYINTNGIPILSYIEDDKNLSVFDIKGENIFNLPPESNVVKGVKKALCEIGVI